MANLADVSGELAKIVATVGESMVRVDGRGRFPASGIVWPTSGGKEGFIVTAHHVVTEEENIQVGLRNGEKLGATLVGRDPTTDLALLKAGQKLESGAKWDSGENLRVGQLALALGRPGRGVRAALGIISALGESWKTVTGGTIDRYVQPDVTMYPGFSGGPLVSAEGNIVGINTSALLRGAPITVPTTTVRRVVEELMAKGRIARGYLGVGVQPATLPAGLAKQLDQEAGLLVISVEPGSPAEGAGLVLGDTLVALDGKPLRHWDELMAGLGKERIGKAATLKIVRAGQVLDLPATIGEHP